MIELHARQVTAIIRHTEELLEAIVGRKIQVVVLDEEMIDRKYPIADILKVVAESLGMEMDDYKKKTREWRYTDLRKVGVKLAILYGENATLHRLAKLYDQDHASILTARDRAKDLLSSGDQVLTKKYLIAKHAVKRWIEDRSK